MDINQQGPTSPEEYETALFAAKFAMTNEELDKAIDTAARHSGTTCGRLMFDHLQKLLAIQYARAGVVRVSVEKVDADETAHNVEFSGGAPLHGAASAGTQG